MEEASCEFRAWGHPNIRATHPTTLEVTREPHLTLRGDCIVAVKAELAALSLPQTLKRLIQREGSTVILELEVGGERFQGPWWARLCPTGSKTLGRR